LYEKMDIETAKAVKGPMPVVLSFKGIHLHNRPRLFPKDAICQLLAESVHSYSYTCKIIAEFSFKGGISPLVPEVGYCLQTY
jgi:hypothetical protein